MSLCVQKLSLTNFRNYEVLRLDISHAPQVVLAGANGAGKTNILEAVSLLTPGKGLRGAGLDEITRRTDLGGLPSENLWAVAAELQSAADLPVRIGTGLDHKRDTGKARRIIRVNGKEVKGQDKLSEHVAAIWLTPQMDRIFIDGPAARRKFLDRLVFAYTPDHVTHLNRHDKNMRERLRLLTEHRSPDPVWLRTLEQNIAADAVSIAAARAHVLARLSTHLAHLSLQQSLFPVPAVDIACNISALMETMPAVTAEEKLQEDMRLSRAQDAAAGRTLQGIHRADFKVSYNAKNMPAEHCSTGEQKGLMLSLVLAHAQMMRSEKGFVPLLLLDEVAAHLDDGRRLQLLSQFRELGGQVWLTGTDIRLFESLPEAAVFNVEQAQAQRAHFSGG